MREQTLNDSESAVWRAANRLAKMDPKSQVGTIAVVEVRRNSAQTG